MAGRLGLDPTEESKSFSALFVLMVALLLAGAVWAIWDDNISRRPWKQFQVEFDELAYNSLMKKAADEDARLGKDPKYVKLNQELAAAKEAYKSGTTTARLDDLNTQLKAAKVIADDKDQVVRFTKSELTERWRTVMAKEYNRLCRKADRGDDDTLIDPYGANDPAEFFAVISETFFDVPVDLRVEYPRLYALLKDYYRQDPAEWGLR